MSVDVAADLPVVQANPLRIRQVVLNLLSNAIKFTGLGLPLAEQLVARHGGKLHIESAPGAGTRVEVWLPPSRVLQSAA